MKIRKWTPKIVKAQFGIAATEYITVCASCLMACCWQGEFYCDDYKNARTVKRTVRDLIALSRENPSYWARGKDSA